jgi:hypothetical protein
MSASTLSAVEFERNDDPRTFIASRADQVRFLYIPYRRYLMIDGSDPPGGPAFRASIGALYPVAYALHFALKRRGVDAPIGALEGLYWVGQPGPIPIEKFEATGAGETMRWRLLLPLPEQATDEEVESAIHEVAAKRPPEAGQLRCEGWLEGECAQILHIGPYDAEYPTVSRMQLAIAEAGLQPRGCHHEIYLGGPATPAGRTKTVIRQPVEDVGW